jgi:DNA-binding MurR/RpiR family transcriptional regulator
MKTSLQSESARAATGTAFARSELGSRLREQHQSGSTSNRAIADHLLRNPVVGASQSIEDLAAAAGVSTATLSRFARALGYGGFPELRLALADTVQGLLIPVEKLRGALTRSDEDDPLRDGLQQSLGNVRATAEGIDPAAIGRIVKRLAAAQSIYVMGFGLSSHLASLLTLGLQPFCRQLVNVVEFGGTEVAAGKLMNIEAGDELIAISFPRYAADAVHLTRFAADRGAGVIAITDSIASPLAELADESLLAQSTHPILSSSNVAAVLVVEALVSAFMVSNADNVEKATRLTDAISAYLLPQSSRGR